MTVRILRSRLAVFLVKAILAGGVLALLFVSTPPESVLDALEDADVPLLVPALLLVPVFLYFRILRWRQLLAISGETTRWSADAATILTGYAFSTVTPMDAGDYVSRVRTVTTIPAPKVVALMIVEKLIHGALVVLLGLPAALALVLHSASAGVTAITVGMALLLMAAMFRRTLTAHPVARRVAVRFGWMSGLDTLHDLSLRSLLPVVASSFAVLFAVYLQEYFLLNAVTSATLLDTWQGYWAGIGVRILAPIFLGDLGIREATHVYFFGLLGIDSAAALSASLLMFLLNILLPAVAGLVVWLSAPKGSR